MGPTSTDGWTPSDVPTAIELRTAEDPRLAGTLHLPDGPPIATVVMVPGSGPTHRDNDTYFPPIRDGLLAAGIAVASFDKRGVGRSEGDWHDTDPVRQAGDVAAQLACVRDQAATASTPVGLFGHSQGGWVVLDVAAADATVAFVVTNSGPGVTWARQGRYATGVHLAASGERPESIEAALRAYDRVVELVRDGAAFDEVQRAAGDAGLTAGAPADAAELDLARAWLDHDPRAALERIRCPVLALFGGADRIVPVDESVAVFEAARQGRPGAPRVEVFEGADHRIRIGEPPTLHPDHLPTLTRWIRSVVA